MIVYRTRKDLEEHLGTLRNQGKSIALVPTMGALHEGHASLVRKAAEENDAIIVSIFVNPTQFNDPADLDKYPRTLEQDLEMLQALRVHLVFVPSVKEMYPEEDRRAFELGNLDKVLEGEHRPGHFTGVAQIVTRLFDLVKPSRAYFGQKDFQQLVIVRRLVEVMKYHLEIIGCPIVREEDGLALSSRNTRLSQEERKLAPFIYQTLKLAREKKGTMSPEQVRSWVHHRFEQQGQMKLEYFEIVDDELLKPITDWNEEKNKVGCIAVHLGEVRLIDNLKFN